MGKGSRKLQTGKSQIYQVVNSALSRKTETKWLVVDHTAGVNVPSSGSSTVLFEMANGPDYNERIGMRIRPVHLALDYSLEPLTTAESTHIRVSLVQAKAGVDINTTDLPGLDEMFNPDQLSKYNVLYDKSHRLVQQVTGAAYPSRRFKVRIPAKKFRDCKWLASSTGATAPDDGGEIILYAQSDDASTPYPQMVFEAVCKYKDT